MLRIGLLVCLATICLNSNFKFFGMLRTRFFVWHKIPSIISDFFCGIIATICLNSNFRGVLYAAVSGAYVIVAFAALFYLVVGYCNHL